MYFSATTDSKTVFDHVRQDLERQGFHIVKEDLKRPWGGFFVLDEGQASEFIKIYFPELSLSDFTGFEKLSPKILVVAPHKRLSWQYHFRRAEIWRVISNHAGVVMSDTDVETPMKKLSSGSVVRIKQGERHRLIGVDEWGIISEIWQHTDREHPSDESDIVRLQDDYGR